MVTLSTDKRVISEKEARFEFDGRWFLINKKDFPPAEDMGYVVAYGNGTPEDRDALDEYNWEKYNGKAFLLKGYYPKDDIHDCRIVEEV